MTRVALVGGSGGIGAAILTQLCERKDIISVQSTYYRSPAGGALGSIGQFGSDTDVVWTQMDASEESSVADWLGKCGPFDWLINCAGFLHDTDTQPEKSLSQFNADSFNKSMAINCLPNLLLAKHASSNLKQASHGVFASITAKVGSIEDNRLGGWYSYRTAKAAANMALKNISIEWQRTLPNVRVVALHPGTTDTKLSAPFQKRVPDGKLFSTEKTAGLLLERLDELHEKPSGRFVAYDGEEIPW